MKLAVLNCDEIKPSFSEKFGQYPAMFETALNNLDIRYNIVSYDIQKGIYPKNIAENHVYIITGSQSAVYEKHDWLENLFEFIREINKKEIGLIGICFGHQAIAHALGGNVEKAKSGWHIGLKPLEVQDNELFIKTEYLINDKNLLYKMSKNSFIKYQHLYCNSPVENWDMILKD